MASKLKQYTKNVVMAELRIAEVKGEESTTIQIIDVLIALEKVLGTEYIMKQLGIEEKDASGELVLEKFEPTYKAVIEDLGGNVGHE